MKALTLLTLRANFKTDKANRRWQFLLLILLTFGFGQLKAQTIVVTGGTTATASSPYSTLSAAITAINSGGAFTGPVTVDVPAGYTETLSAAINLTETGTSANPLIIQKSGAGLNPKLSAYTGTFAGYTTTGMDAMFILNGSDYVTIDGIDMEDATASNTTNAMEFCINMVRPTTTDGCQYNTIKNCTLKLSTFGVYVICMVNNTATSSTVTTPTAASGSNSYNTFKSNTLKGGQIGIFMRSFAAPSPYTLADWGNTIGGPSATDGNLIVDFGNATGSKGVFINNQWDCTTSYNTINNNLSGTYTNASHSVLQGIFYNISGQGASAYCYNNDITLKYYGTTTGSTITPGSTNSYVVGIDMEASSTTGGGNKAFVRNNIIHNCSYNNATATIPFAGILNFSKADSVDISNNEITGLTLTATLKAIYVYGIINGAAVPVYLKINNNNIHDLTEVNTSTQMAGIYNSTATVNHEVKNNTINNFTRITGAATAGNMYGYYNNASPASGTSLIYQNTFTNFNNRGAAITVLQNNLSASETTIVRKNIINNITSTTGQVYGIFAGFGNASSTLDSNSIMNINGAGGMNPLYAGTSNIGTVNDNEVGDVSTSGAGNTCQGIYAGGATVSVFRNNIHGLTSTNATGIVTGIQIPSGTTVNVYNNLITDLKASTSTSSSSINGIFIAGGTTMNISHNTIYPTNLTAITGGANAGAAGVYIGSATPTVNLKNNIINITGTPTGTSYVSAVKRISGAASVKPANLNMSNNIYYAPYIYGEGLTASSATNVYYESGGAVGTADPSFNTGCGLFKLFMLDAGSFYENNLTAVGAYFAPSGASFAESGATTSTTPSITTDIVSATRGTYPDIGAMEFIGTSTDAVAPAISFTNIPNTICTTDAIFSATITDAAGVNVASGTAPRLWFKKSTENNAYNGNTVSDNGWKYVEALNTTSPFQFSMSLSLLNTPAAAGDVIQYFVAAQDLATSPNVSVNLAAFPSGYCPLTVSLDPAAYPVSGAIKSFTVLPDPVTVTSVASNTSLCVSGNTVLSLSGDASTGAFYQWQSSPTGTTWTDIAGATTATYTYSGLTATSYFRCEISCGDLVANGGSPITINNSTPVLVNVNSPSFASTTPGSRCGTGTVTLTATPNGAGNVKWYAGPSGGTSIGSGTSFTTPSIASTTTYYATSTEGGISGINVPSPTIGTSTFISTAVGWGLRFTANSPFDITSVKIKALNTVAATATVQIKVTDLNDVVVYTGTNHSFAVTTALAEYVIPVGITGIAPGNYKMGMTYTNLSNAVRESSGVTFPYTSPGGECSITAGANGTGSAQTTTAYYWFYNWVISTGCESARVPVIATVTAADPVTISGSGTVECNDTYVALDVTSPLANYDSYIWTPTTNLYADNLGTPYVGGSATSVFVKSSTAGATTYTLNATNSISGCANTVSGSTTFLPGASLSISGNSDVCISGSKTLTLSPTTGLSASNIQWNMNGNPISGANSLTYATGTLTTTTSYSADLIDGNANVCLTTPSATVLVNNPVLTGTTPGSRCGAGTVNLSASATAVNSAPIYNWYSAASGGAPLYSGPLNTFTTPLITATTDFYVSASEGGGGGTNVGKSSVSPGQSFNTGTAAYMIFSAFSNFTLNTIKVYPYGTVDNVPGTMTISIANSSGTVLQSATVNVIANTAANPNPQVVPVNFAITPGTDYRILFTAYSGGVSGALRDLTSASPAPVFPYTIPGVVSITNSSIAGYYYYFYDWNVSTACESARQAVTATVTSAPSINVTTSSSNTCVGNQVQLEVTSTNPDYTYSWTSTPSGFTASGAGPFNTTISGNTTYNVTAIDNTTGTYAGCGAIGSTSVSSVPNLLSLSVNATPATVCSGSNSQLEAIPTIPSTGYTMNASCTASFVDISTTGTSVGTLGDDLEYNVTIPSFTYNGVAYTDMRLGTNGVIAFGATTGDVPVGNTALPATTVTTGNLFLAPYWDDLDINLGGTIKTQTVGNTFIIQYTNIDHNLFTTGGITFQVQLDLTTGVISYVYQDVVFGSATYDNGLTATVGLQTSATSALQYSFNTASLTNGQSICFTPIPTTPTVTYDWTANSTYLSATNIANPIATAVTSNQTYTVVVTDASGCTKSATKLVDIVNCSSTLNLTLFLQGYYTGSNTMQEVMANQGYLPTPATGDCDDITVELHDATTTTTIAGTTTARLHADGTASAVFTPGVTGNYYVVIKHRNSIQTWSTDPVTLSSTTSYNFSAAATQAYADNMVEVETGVWAIYTGDLNQDDFIDSFDFPIFDLDATNGVAGVYVATDMNGDGFVDPFDFPVFDVNSFNGVLAVYP